MTRVAPLLCLALAATACHWREGNAVWIERYDADTDRDGDADGCASDEVAVLTPAELLSLVEAETAGLVIVDVRPASLCQAMRIPGAQCIPFEEGALSAPIEGLATASHVVFYDQALEQAAFAAEGLELGCDQRRAVLVDGLAGWLELGYPTESGD